MINGGALLIPLLLASGYGSWRLKQLWETDVYRRIPVRGDFRYAAVADDGGICSQIGVDIMVRKNGSTTDAAIATKLCMCASNPQSSGLAGSLVMTIYDTPRGGTEKEVMTIIARGAAPLAAHKDMFEHGDPYKGGLAMTVPGLTKGLHEAWLRYGRLEWAELVMPTVRLLRQGIPTNRVLAMAFNIFSDRVLGDDNLRATFTKPDGSFYLRDEPIKRPLVARSYEQIAENPMAMYDEDSQLAQDFLADIRDIGGIITAADMKAYKPRLLKPDKISLSNGGYDVYAPTSPTGGPILLHILAILDGYNFTSGNIATMEQRVLTYHRMIEAFKFAYGKRSAMGDPEFVDNTKVLEELLSHDFAESRRLMIDDDQTLPFEAYDSEFNAANDHGTSHGGVLGLDGSAVAFTSSINAYFGCQKQGTRTGIIFNDEMDDFGIPGKLNHFDLPASPANYIEPGKMSLSSMTPVIFLDKEGVVRYVGGASGGTSIASTVAFIAVHTLWLGMPLDHATGIFRFHHQLMPNTVCLEREFTDFTSGTQPIVAGLREKGHVMQEACFLSVAQTIHNTCDARDMVRDKPCITAVSDGRKVGVPDGV